MIINIQAPEENRRNFYPEQKIFNSQASEFADVKSLRKSPLAEAIFDIGGIESVLIAPDMVSVVKEDTSSWDDLAPQIMAEILDFAVTGEAAVLEASDPVLPEAPQTDRELMKKIEGLVAARIRPALKKDGGDIELKSFAGGTLLVELTGKCSGCPYAMRTLKDGVEKILKDYIPEVSEVKPVSKESL